MINLEVRTEAGATVTRGSRGLDWMKTLGRIDGERFPFLGGTLPYADTMFNSRQVERLLKELSNGSVREVLGEDSVAEIERLCLEVERGTHVYLWFLGD